jgi:hypothetical protein
LFSEHCIETELLIITSGSVRHRPIAIKLDVRMPSVHIGPTKFCMLGVKRKGTASGEASIGA